MDVPLLLPGTFPQRVRIEISGYGGYPEGGCEKPKLFYLTPLHFGAQHSPFELAFTLNHWSQGGYDPMARHNSH